MKLLSFHQNVIALLVMTVTAIASAQPAEKLDSASLAIPTEVLASQLITDIPAHQNVNITIDGRLDEVAWQHTPSFDNMRVVEPDTLKKTTHSTRTQIFYTDEGLYVGVQAEQPASSLIPRLSSRDKQVNRDGVTFYLDTSGQGLYGFFFGINLGGSLTDGTFLPERQFSNLWDGPWSGAVTETATGYSTEMFLPWSMMSMPEGIQQMAFAVNRRVAYLDETWQWPALPESKPRFMSGLQPITLDNVKPRQQLAFYPFAAATRDRTNNGESKYRIGADIFWRPSTNLQLTATLNPDFGAVESDDVVVNLTSFETFFPEKRLFFLEGTEIFITSPRSEVRGTGSSTGARAVPNSFFLQPTTLVNTRRIGGPARAPTIPDGTAIADVELGLPTELIGATKITGQNGSLRYGLMMAFEEDSTFHGQREDGTATRVKQIGRDFGVFRLLHEASGKGRRAFGFLSTITSHPEDDAITQGIDWHYRSPSSQFIWDGQLMYSDVDDTKGAGGFFDMNYIPKQGTLHRFSFDYLDDKLDINDLGFIRRNDAITYRYTYSLTNSKNPKFRLRNDNFTLSHETNTDGRMVRSSFYYRNTLTFHNRNQLNSTFILRPEQWDDRKTEGNGEYKTHSGGIAEFAFGTDTSKQLSASIATSVMTEQLGDLTYSAKGGISYKPHDRISIDLDFIYRQTDDWLVHLSGSTLGAYDARHWQPSIAVDLFLSAKQQLRFSLQWVGIKAKADNLYEVPNNDGELIQITDGITEPTYDFTISQVTTQLRYRWEIAPLSDLFIVYTRGSNLPNRQSDAFNDLFRDALTNPIIDTFVVKLRYRISS